MRILSWQVHVMLTTILMTVLSTKPVAAQESAPHVTSGYASVNGLKMYYESHGAAHGKPPPLVLLHGGGSTIATSFGRVLPSLAKTRQVIAFEQQGHGRTADVDRPFTFEQSADDAAALLRHLKIESADLFGFSNGGHIALQVGIRHPKLVRKLVVASAGFTRDGYYPQFWEFMKRAQLENMPRELRDAYLKVAPHPEHLRTFHDKCATRMLDFKDWRPEDVQSIKAAILVMIGDADGVRPEHAVEMFRLLPNARLAVLPSDHGTYLGEVTAAKKDSKLPQMVVSMVEEFLDAPMSEGEPQMSSHTPQDWPRQFTQHLNTGDLEAVVALYEPDARFVAQSGETVVGRDRIRDVLARLISANTRLHSRVIQAVTVGEVALLYTDFQGTTVDASGTTVEIRHKAIEVLRRQPDGTWKLIVGDPNGREGDGG